MSEHVWAKVAWRDVAFVLVIILVAVGGLRLTFPEPTLATVVLLGLLGGTLWRWHTRVDLMLALSGALLGPVLEFFATGTGLWTYRYPSVGLLPAWIFVLWPTFPIALWRLSNALLPTPTPPARATRELALGLTVVALEIPTLCLLGNSSPWMAALLTAVLMVLAAVWVGSVQAWLMLFISGGVGPFCEWFLIDAGAWSYPSAWFLGMPAWLPTGYALFGFALVRTALGAANLVPSRSRMPSQPQDDGREISAASAG